MAETRVRGRCRCGRRVVLCQDSPVSGWRDKTRYAYPETVDENRWNIFRCEDCHEPIRESFVPDHCPSCEDDRRDPAGRDGHTHQSGTVEHPDGGEAVRG